MIDVFSDKICMGGAPLNFSAHIKKLGNEVYLCSAVGNDSFGTTALENIKNYGIKEDFITVNNYPTGRCDVILEEGKFPVYDIIDNAAYDYIEYENKNVNFDAIYLGTLALRHERNRTTLEKLIADNKNATVFCDINMRKPFISREAVKICFGYANVLKISREELDEVCRIAYDKTFKDEKEAAKFIAENEGNIETIVITLDSDGAFAYNCKKNKYCYEESIETKVVSTVGAGDSFSASFFNSYMAKEEIGVCLKKANKLAAFVASKLEAIPEYSGENEE